MKTYTDEELNIAICEWRGWKWLEEDETTWFREVWARNDTTLDPSGKTIEEKHRNRAKVLPSHITGIEALGNLHEAEKGLNEQQQTTYTLFLHRNSNRIKSDYLGRDFDVLHSTAREKGIALLRVVNPKMFQETEEPKQ